MTSLMQFKGETSRTKGVRLIGYQEGQVGPHGAAEVIGDTGLPVLWAFWRKPRGLFGPWVVFEYNGEMEVPDLSIPIRFEKVPKGAVRLSDEEALTYWRSP